MILGIFITKAHGIYDFLQSVNFLIYCQSQMKKTQYIGVLWHAVFTI